ACWMTESPFGSRLPFVFFRQQEVDKRPAGRRQALAAADEDARVNRLNLAGEAADADLVAARDDAARHQGHDRYTEPGLDHADDDLRVGRLHVHARRQAAAVEGVDDVLPAGGAALEENEWQVGEVGELSAALH